jgi:hypothetical protein
VRRGIISGVKYCRYRWSESRGDAYDHWGHATYYFAVADDGIVVEQAEVYENGCSAVRREPPLRSRPENGEGRPRAAFEVSDRFSRGG